MPTKFSKAACSRSKVMSHSSLPIRGAIYYTGNHFVSRIISPTEEVWYHDGIETKH
jgi:hypothetical protein